MRHRSIWAGCLALWCLAGCDRGSVDLSPVRGTVYHQGKPLTGGTIVFTPDPERGGSGPLAAGEIQEDGTFSLKTDGKPGAVPGWHRITVKSASPRAADGESPKAEEKGRLPIKYSDPDRSGQTYEVKAGRVNDLELHLE